MKTAVSVPDDLFRLAESANRLQDNSITERLNEVYSRRPEKVDSALHRAQLQSIEKDSR